MQMLLTDSFSQAWITFSNSVLDNAAMKAMSHSEIFVSCLNIRMFEVLIIRLL